jgi:hypothetical protein
MVHHTYINSLTGVKSVAAHQCLVLEV